MLLSKWLCHFHLKSNTLWQKVTVSKYRLSFEWTVQGLNALPETLEKVFRRSFLSSLFISIVQWRMEGYFLLGGLMVGDWPFCSLSPGSYHLSLIMRNHSMAGALLYSLSSTSPILGFRRPLSMRETTDIVALLLLIGKFYCIPRRRNVYILSSCPSKGFYCKSFFHCLVDPFLEWFCLCLATEGENSKEG